MVLATKKYILPEIFDIVKEAFAEGRPVQLETGDYWLHERQARELGFDVEGDFKLPLDMIETPLLPGEVPYGRLYPSMAGERPDVVASTVKQWATEYPDEFLDDLQTKGRTPDTEALLRSFGATDDDLQQMLLSDKVTAPMPGFKMPVGGLRPVTAPPAVTEPMPTLTWLDKVKEIRKDPVKLVPFVSSGVEIFTIGKLLLTAQDLEAGREVSQEDLLTLKEYVDRSIKNADWGYKVADVISQLVPFAGEFIATGGIFAIGKTAAVKASTAALKKIATKTGAKILEKALAKYGVQVVGTVAGGTLRTIPAGITRIPASTLEKQLIATLTGDEESIWLSARKAFGEQWVEIVSESTGGLFAPLSAPIKGQLIKIGIFKAFLKANPTQSVNNVRRVAEKLGYHGVFPEMLEERVADVGHGILEPLGLSDQKFNIPSLQQLSVELVSFSIPGVAAKAVESVPGMIEKLTPSVRKAISEAAAEAKIAPERGAVEIPGKKPAVPEKVIPKEAWQITQAEHRKIYPFAGADAVHRSAVFGAVNQGKPVPAEVLANYPDLAKQAKVTPVTPEVTLDEQLKAFEAKQKAIIPTEAEYLKQKLVDYKETLKGTGFPLDVKKQTEIIKQEYKTKYPVIPKAEVGMPEAVIPEEVELEYKMPRGLRTRLNKLAKERAEFIDKEDLADVLAAYKEGETARLEDLGDELGISDWTADAITVLEQEAGERFMAARPVRPVAPAAVPVEEVAPPPIPPTPPVEGVVAPPMPEGAAKRVFERMQTEPAEEGFTEKVRQGYHKFQVKMVDDLYAIKRFTEAYTKGGIELSIEENPYLLARLLRGISGKANVFIEQGTFGKTFWKIEKGKTVPNFTGESLENILKEVREPGAWQDFSTYLVARRSVELSARDIETGITLEDAKAAVGELEAKHKNFPDLAKRVYKYQDNLLVYGKEMGLLSEDLLGKLRKYGNYVPFYRVFNELQAKGFMGKKMADIASPIKRIKGSEREILNPLESIIKNTYMMISAADRNQVGIMMANLVDKNPELAEMFERVKTPIARVARVSAKEIGVEIEGLSEEDAEAVVDIFRPSFFVRGDEVTVLIDGKKAYFKVDPDLRDGLLSLDRETMGIIGKFLSLPAKWLRAGATLSPDFMVRNPARDALTAFAYSNYNFLPGVDFMRGIAGIIRKDADYQLFRASGAEHSMMVSMDREYLHKTFNEVVQGKKFTDYIKHPLELFQIISELGEKATRLGEFKAGIRSGAVPLEAGYSARAVTLDFAQAGTTAHAVNRLIAFFNANIRGWGRLFSSFKEHPTRTALKVFVGITLPSILLYLANRDDDRWKEIPQWQKDLFWIVMTKDNIYRIPKPFELGIIFGSMPERFLEWLDNKDPKLLKEVLVNFAEAGSPGFLPTAILPIIENMTNYSFFRGGKIVPASREKMPPELQYTAWTSEVSKKLGELLKLPPAKIDNLINGWTGGLGRYATDILGTILKKTGISPDIPEPTPELADIPVIKAFVVRNPYGSSGEAVESFYDVLEKYEQGEKYLQEMLKLGEQDKFEKYKADHPELIFLFEMSEDPEKENIHYSASARYLRRVARDLSELGKKQDLIYKAKDISSEEKRRLIDEIDILKTELTRKALDLLQGKEPQLLQDSLNESINRLGEVVEETPVLSLEKPDIFDMKHLHTDFGDKLEAAKKEDLDKLTNIDPLAYAYLKVKGIEKTIDPIVNKKIYEVKPDLKEGITFEDYYKAWQGGIVKDEVLSNLTRRQVELLRKYHGLDKVGQRQFLIDNPELAINPRIEWLKANPKENAQLAVWGQAKILTKEAYNEFKSLIKSLDIPDSAIPELTLPPEGSIDNYFKYQDMENTNSWEAKLMLAKDTDLLKFLGRQPIDTPIASLELKVKNRANFDKLDSYSDKDSPDYIADEKKRAETIKKFKVDNPGFVDDTRRIEAIENKADDVEAWVERGNTIDEFGAGSSEAKVWLIDHPEVHKWAVAQKLLVDDGATWNIPVLRIDVKYRKEDAEYDALPTTGTDRADYLTANDDYRMDRRRREAYQKGLTTQVENYVSYYELPIKGYRQERFLFNNPDFANALKLKIPDKVPSEEYDILLEKTDRTPEDEFRMDAYKMYIPDELVEDYVGYKTIPKGTYEDDWFLQEHPDFYKQVYLGILGKERKDYRKVPTREVFAKYQEYLTFSSRVRENYRFDNPDLEDWLILTGAVTKRVSETRRRAELTPAERLAEDVAERLKRIRALGEPTKIK